MKTKEVARRNRDRNWNEFCVNISQRTAYKALHVAYAIRYGIGSIHSTCNAALPSFACQSAHFLQSNLESVASNARPACILSPACLPNYVV